MNYRRVCENAVLKLVVNSCDKNRLYRCVIIKVLSDGNSCCWSHKRVRRIGKVALKNMPGYNLSGKKFLCLLPKKFGICKRSDDLLQISFKGPKGKNNWKSHVFLSTDLTFAGGEVTMESQNEFLANLSYKVYITGKERNTMQPDEQATSEGP